MIVYKWDIEFFKSCGYIFALTKKLGWERVLGPIGNIQATILFHQSNKYSRCQIVV